MQTSDGPSRDRDTIHPHRRAVLGALAWVVAPTPLVSALADTGKASPTLALIMIEEAGCPYCRRWDREVHEAYLASDEGQRAPLRRLLMGSTEARRFERVTWSPTFILMRGETEIGRIIGYPGADFFWALLAELLAEAATLEPNGRARR